MFRPATASLYSSVNYVHYRKFTSDIVALSVTVTGHFPVLELFKNNGDAVFEFLWFDFFAWLWRDVDVHNGDTAIDANVQV
jgi:hypothetical protein